MADQPEGKSFVDELVDEYREWRSSRKGKPSLYSRLKKLDDRNSELNDSKIDRSIHVQYDSSFEKYIPQWVTTAIWFPIQLMGIIIGTFVNLVGILLGNLFWVMIFGVLLFGFFIPIESKIETTELTPPTETQFAIDIDKVAERIHQKLEEISDRLDIDTENGIHLRLEIKPKVVEPTKEVVQPTK
jgi:hypothetical protein